MSEIARVKGRLAKLTGSPTLQACFSALAFEWRSGATRDKRQTINSRAEFNGRRVKGYGTHHIFRGDTGAAACVLWDCRKHWLALAKNLHPDHGGDAEAMALLNVAWRRIEELFARRGIRLD